MIKSELYNKNAEDCVYKLFTNFKLFLAFLCRLMLLQLPQDRSLRDIIVSNGTEKLSESLNLSTVVQFGSACFSEFSSSQLFVVSSSDHELILVFSSESTAFGFFPADGIIFVFVAGSEGFLLECFAAWASLSVKSKSRFVFEFSFSSDSSSRGS